MFHLIVFHIVPPPFPPDPLPGVLHRLAQILAWLHSRPIVRPTFAGLAALVLPTRLTLVFDVESDPPQLLGTYQDVNPEDSNDVFYLDSNGDSKTAPADCVSVVSYDAVAAFGPKRASFAESATSLVRDDDAIEALRENSTPVPGRDGVRQDADGRVWYSAQWLGLKS